VILLLSLVISHFFHNIIFVIFKSRCGEEMNRLILLNIVVAIFFVNCSSGKGDIYDKVKDDEYINDDESDSYNSPDKNDFLDYDKFDDDDENVEIAIHDNDFDENDDSDFDSEESDHEDTVIDFSVCYPNPCIMEFSDGKCKESGYDYECGCIDGFNWLGKKCVPDPCDPNPCTDLERSTGECLFTDSDFFCVCENGYFYDSGKCVQYPDVIYVDQKANGKNNGSSWEDAFNSLSDAIEEAGSPTKVKWIWVAQGVYKPEKVMQVGLKCSGSPRCYNFVLRNNVSMFGGFSGFESKLDERDWEKNQTILSGDIDNSDTISSGDVYNVFLNYDINRSAVLDGFIVEFGNADYKGSDINGDHMKFGGGVCNFSNAHPTVRNCFFRNNYSYVMGGAVSNTFGSHPLIEDSVFTENSSFRGAAVGSSDKSNAVIKKCSFINNSSEGMGGAVFNLNGSNVTISDSYFESNTANDGGAIVNSKESNIKIFRSYFYDNYAERNGGAISSGNDTSFEVSSSVFAGNFSKEGGGAIEIYLGGISKIISSHFYNNSTDENRYGGAIKVSSSRLNVVNSLFVGNISGNGGGIYNQWSEVRLLNNTFSYNIAKNDFDGGGALYGYGLDTEFIITNSILYYNFSEGTGNEIYNDLSETFISFSDIENSYISGKWNSSFGSDEGNNIDASPLFKDPEQGDFSLKKDSPCINAGSNKSYSEGEFAEGIATDILGNPRESDGKIDIGAYESVN
jgi:predicted outer membrane repeat protein